VFGGQVTALQINSKAFLAAANVALGGGGGDISNLNTLATNLNESFDNCKQSDGAWSNLSTEPK
jgi:hypothetical protein